MLEEYINKKVVENVFDGHEYMGLSYGSISMESKQVIQDIFNTSFKSPKNTHLLLCVLNYLIYKYNKGFYNLIDDWGLDPEQFSIVNYDDELVYGTYTSGKNVVYFFKGSSNLKDFLSDIQIAVEASTQIKGKIHKGFYDILRKDSRYLWIMKSIFSLDTGTTIYLTGHSLGAALATIIYCYAGTVFTDRIKLVTFGCPRLGNQEFTDQIKGDSIRIVNNNDAVTKLPVPFWSYRHYSIKKLLGYENKFKYSLSDHAIDSYYSSIWFSSYD